MSVAEVDRGTAPDGRGAPSGAPSTRWARWRRLDGVRFPLVVYALWRMAQAAVVWWYGGRLTELAYTYDGAHYLRILHYGYEHPRPVMPSHAFFPGVPWAATPLRWLTGSDVVAVHVTATVTAAAAFVAVWGVTRAWVDERTARRAVVLLALFPSSLFLWAFYSEAAFIALGAGGVWADRRDRPVIAAACFAGLATTRSVGVVVPVVVVVVHVVRERRLDRRALAYLAAGAVGLGAVLLTMWAEVGDAFAFLGVQADWGRTVSWPWASVAQGVDNLTPDARTVMVPALVARNLDLWAVALVVLAIGYLVVSRRPRFPAESWLLGLAMIALPLSSSVLASFNRFALADWVIYPAWASMLGRLPTWWRRAATAGLALAAVVTAYHLLGRVVAGRFIG